MTFNIPYKASLIGNKYSDFFFKKIFISSSLLKDTFIECKILDWFIFFSRHFIHYSLLSFCLHGFQGEVRYNFFICSICNAISLWLLPEFFFFNFYSLKIICLVNFFLFFFLFSIVLLGIIWVSWPCGLVSEIHVKKSQPFLFKIFILFLPFFFLILISSLHIYHFYHFCLSHSPRIFFLLYYLSVLTCCLLLFFPIRTLNILSILIIVALYSWSYLCWF